MLQLALYIYVSMTRSHSPGAKWKHGGPLEEREAPHLGCELPGHLCPLLLSPCHQGGRGSSRADIGEEGDPKYVNLELIPEHLFSTIAVETMGVLGLRTKALLRDLGRRVTQTTVEEAATTHLVQRLSVAVQRGNLASVMGTTDQLNSRLFYWLNYQYKILYLYIAIYIYYWNYNMVEGRQQWWNYILYYYIMCDRVSWVCHNYCDIYIYNAIILQICSKPFNGLKRIGHNLLNCK